MSECGSNRLVEYFLVVGVDSKNESQGQRGGGSGSVVSPPTSPLSALAEEDTSSSVIPPLTAEDVTTDGVVLQRYPATDHKETALPAGIAMFCQPLGWFITQSHRPPFFTNFILTAEDSSRLYCTTLNFHQVHKVDHSPPTERKSKGKRVSMPDIKANQSSKQMQKRYNRWTSTPNTPQFMYEDQTQLEDLIFSSRREFYEPVSLCVLSKFPFFDIFQACLKALYITWVSCDSKLHPPLEPLVVDLLTELRIPAINCLPVKRSFGSLKELVLYPIFEESSLPYTSDAAIKLLRSVGVHQTLELLAAVLSDISILFISSSYTALTSSVRAICTLIYPLQISHSLVPILPAALVDYVQLPSTYIMGIHSSLRDKVEDELTDVVEVYLDSGHVRIPDTIILPRLPFEVADQVSHALATILNAKVDSRDYVFPRATPSQGSECIEGRPEELMDKEVRAVFLCLFTYLLGDYQNYITVIRFKPPSFYFNNSAFLTAKPGGDDQESLFYKLVNSIPFFNYCHERSIPFRVCDYFDELVARFASNPEEFDAKGTYLFSRPHIQELAEELLNVLPSNSHPVYDLAEVTPEVLENPLKTFPQLKDNEINEALTKFNQSDDSKTEGNGGAKEQTPVKDPSSTLSPMRNIPLLECSPTHKRQSSAFLRDFDALKSCLDAIFHGKIIEARKYVPTVTQALKNGILSDVLVPELVEWFMEFGVLLSSEQFDLIVKFMNCAIVDEHTALLLLPLTTIVYRELNPGVQQYACTCLQSHCVWSKTSFWRHALFLAIQAELVRIYSDFELQEKIAKSREKAKEARKKTEKESSQSPDHESAEVGDITMKSRHRVRSASPSRLRATLKATQRLIMSRSARIRMRASVVVPGVSEGVLPPDAEPVTAQEALHHLAKMLKIWPTLSEEKQTILMRQEENAIMNQLVLFVQRIINLRIPVEFTEGEEERESFISELETFIGQLLKMVEVELKFDYETINKISGQIHDLIVFHLESLTDLRKELKRLPVAKPKVIKPPLLPGEVLLLEQGVHAYLLPDGRDNGLLLPADGHVFLTSYRVIFLGAPCDAQAPSYIVTRSMPVASIFRLKRMPPTPIPQLAITTVGGLQMRSTTAELIRIGYDEEASQMDTKNLLQHIVDLRNPSRITLGLRPSLSDTSVPGGGYAPLKEADPAPPPPVASGGVSGLSIRRSPGKTRSKGAQANVLQRSDTLTRVRLFSDLSQSPYCQEYIRMKLGSLTFNTATKDTDWRVTAINMGYAVCSSYPAALVVPEKVTDESLASVASQFQHQRLPVVTWKHPDKKVVLLRSSSFVPCSIAKKTVSSSALAGIVRYPAAAKQAKIAAAAAASSGRPNSGGIGVYNADVENYLLQFLLMDEGYRPTSALVHQISMPPETVEFDRVGSLRRGKLGSVESWDSVDSGVGGDSTTSEGHHHQPQIRGRAATIDFYKVRTRVGSKVAQITKYTQEVLASKPQQKSKGSPSKKKKMSTRQKASSPLFLRKNRHSHSLSDVLSVGESSSSNPTPTPPSPRSLVLENGDAIKSSPKQEGGEEGELKIREEVDSDFMNAKKRLPRSADSSPQDSPKSSKIRGHMRAKSSDNICDLKGIDLGDIEMIEKQSISSENSQRPMSPIDWEAVGDNSVKVEDKAEEPEPRPSTATPDGEEDGSSPELQHKERDMLDLPFKNRKASQVKTKDNTLGSPGNFSSLPTNPRDWIVMDALPEQLSQWQANALYIIGDKPVLQDIPEDLYPNCTFVPVEVPSPTGIANSFKKLMRACSPSGSQYGASEAGYMTAIQESLWIDQLSLLMQLAGAVADLIDIQGSSVLVCLENGWDTTAQVISLAQILLDPYYRTMEGFKTLIEKDWLSFGHRFSKNGNHTASTHISDFSPVFIQFLDAVHQVCRQFPLSFEFNDFYLRMLAYHHCSMRFHTFTLDSEKERYANNWLPYRPRHAIFHGNAGQMEDYVSYWDHVENLHNNSMLFYNFKFHPNKDHGALRPYSYNANLDVWSFYLDNFLSQFPPYDTELISEGALTLLDMHHNFFEKEKTLLQMGVPIDPPGSVMSEISTLLRHYTGLMNAMATKLDMDQATWFELWEELQESAATSRPVSPLFPEDKLIVTHGQTLHKRTTLAVLIKGKLAVQLEQQLTHPHQFEHYELKPNHHKECAFCKYQIHPENVACKCKVCGNICHDDCKYRMPYNCGQKSFTLKRRASKKVKETREFPEKSHHIRHASSTFYIGRSVPEEAAHVSEGWLYKRGKIVRNWKLRWFILDTEKRDFCYYDSSKDGKCHGSIPIRDIEKVEEAEPQVVPTLKQGEAGFFFTLATQKRVYHLMALRDSERREWIERITTAINTIL